MKLTIVIEQFSLSENAGLGHDTITMKVKDLRDLHAVCLRRFGRALRTTYDVSVTWEFSRGDVLTKVSVYGDGVMAKFGYRSVK